MSEARYDPLSRAWILVSEKRAQRPQGDEVKECPFCPGNEVMTPKEILRRPLNAESWKVRVFPNKFNLLDVEPELNRLEVGVFLRENGVGAHEIIVDHPSPAHHHPADLPSAETAEALMAARDRMLDLVKDKRLKYPVFFKNHGELAGASIAHPHWQLIVLPIVPRRIEDALDACQAYFQAKKVCLVCQMIFDESLAKSRLVIENNSYIAWSYYAPQFPFELMIAPKKHFHRFERSSGAEILGLAYVLCRLFRRLRVATQDAAFNVVLFTSPWFENDVRPTHGATVEHDFHWYFKILPRMTKLAGFEFGTGFYIVPFLPEQAAAQLRECAE